MDHFQRAVATSGSLDGAKPDFKRLRTSSPIPGPSREVGDEPKPSDGLLETLMCVICQEILYDCVSVQPCLHSFCGGCFSDWMQATCPQVSLFGAFGFPGCGSPLIMLKTCFVLLLVSKAMHAGVEKPSGEQCR